MIDKLCLDHTSSRQIPVSFPELHIIMKTVFSLFLGCIILVFQVKAQDMAFFADAMINADREEHRTLASNSFQTLFEEALAVENSFLTSFDHLPWISVQYPMDSTFRTITWQVDQGNGSFIYPGFLQTPTDVYKVTSRGGDDLLRQTGSAPWTDWTGSLIYKIEQVESNPRQYLLFTYRQQDAFTKIKTCEQLSLEDFPQLGNTGQFEHPNNPQHQINRISLTYSADTNTRIFYDKEAKRIIYDNLISVMGRAPGQGPTMVSDGSYKAYELQPDGNWTYIDKLYHQVLSEPPRANLKKKDKDLFGRQRKN